MQQVLRRAEFIVEAHAHDVRAQADIVEEGLLGHRKRALVEQIVCGLFHIAEIDVEIFRFRPRPAESNFDTSRLWPEHDLVHDAAGHERKSACDHKRADEDRNHRDPMPSHIASAGISDAEHQHQRREDR